MKNGCATGGSALDDGRPGDPLGRVRRRRRDRLRQASAAVPSTPIPPSYGLGDWYGETGLMLTTQFFAMKIQRYMHEHDLDPACCSRRSRPRRTATAR